MKRLALIATLLFVRTAWAVGVEGQSHATSRVGVGLASGVDQVGGYAQDAYPFAELYGHAETRLGGWVYLGAAGSFRQDLHNYNYALEQWRGERSPGVALQTFVGYDAERFHISVGPWLYGAGRRRPHFRARVLPYGTLRIRFGSLAAWHGGFQLGDAAPFTASGGYGARIMVGSPARRGHQPSAGIFTSIGEKVIGLIAVDELRSSGKSVAWRFGGSLGTMISHPAHVEAAGFCGVVW